jgi:acetone carboxylase gamma subunit
MTTEATTRCENLACLCEIPLAESTCSPYCASLDGKDVQNIVCECGHAYCKEQNEKQLHGGVGSEGEI